MLRQLGRAAVRLALLSAVLSAPAIAQYPGMTVEWVERTGVGYTTDSFEVWLRIAIADDAPPLNFNGNDPGSNFGLPDDFDLPDQGWNGTEYVPFVAYTQAVTNTAILCSGTFRSGCDDGPYSFSFHIDNSDPSRPSFNFHQTYALAAGSSTEFLMGTFTPVGGAAPAGEYHLFNAYPTISVWGLDAAGEEINASVPLERPCAANRIECAFIRTVVEPTVVPEPGTVLLTAFGLGGLAVAARRRRRAE